MDEIQSNLDSLESQIYYFRGRRVMIDSDLAFLYSVGTKNLNQNVKRNFKRFPEDFMFRLTLEEYEFMRSQIMTAYTENHKSSRSQFVTLNGKQGESSRFQNGTLNDSLNKPNLRSQIVTSNLGAGGRKYLPYAFTEQGIAMLSSVLKSEQAILVNIHIMRTFTKMRGMMASNKELREQIGKLEEKYDANFKTVFDAIELILSPPEIPPEEPRPRIGFRTDD